MMKHLDALIAKHTSGLITRDELETLVLNKAFIAANEICDLNSPDLLGVWERIDNEYATYVAEQLGGWHG